MCETIRKERTTYWRASRNGVLMMFGKSEEKLRKTIRARYRYKKRKWAIKPISQDLPVVTGEIHDWSAEGGIGGTKVHWQCPYCDTPHWEDYNPSEDSPYLLGCFGSGALAIVEVAKAM